MEINESLFQILTVLIVVGQLFKYWYMKEVATKPDAIEKVYKLNIIVFIGYAIIETTVGLKHPEQKSILLFNIVNIWSIIMNAKGLYNWKKKKQLAN